MKNSKNELYDLFGVIVSLLANNENTIIIDNHGTNRGQIYTISKATQKQAESNCGSVTLFSGTAKEVINYLKGVRDCISEFSKK